MIAIGVLAGIVRLARENVLPADVIPVGDRKRKAENIRVADKLAEELVSGRAGAAALRGEKLHHHLRLMGAFGGRLVRARQNKEGDRRVEYELSDPEFVHMV